MSVKPFQRRLISNQTFASPAIKKRSEGDSSLPQITGYAAVFYNAGEPGTEYRLWDDMVERIRPGAFDRAVKEDDVRALFNHDANKVLGRNKSGTLRLSVDARGLKYEIDPPETETAKELLAGLSRGDISGSSFTFIPTKVVWEEVRALDGGGSTYVRWIEDVALFDVGPVTFPAYEATDSEAKGRSTSDFSVIDSSGNLEREFSEWRRSLNAAADMDRAKALSLTIAMDDAE